MGMEMIRERVGEIGDQLKKGKLALQHVRWPIGAVIRFEDIRLHGRLTRYIHLCNRQMSKEKSAHYSQLLINILAIMGQY